MISFRRAKVAVLAMVACALPLWIHSASADPFGPPRGGGRPPPPPPGFRPPPPPPPQIIYRDVVPKVITLPQTGAEAAGTAPAEKEVAAPSSPDPMVLAFPRGPAQPDDVAVIVGNSAYSRFSRDLPDVVPAHNDALLVRRYVTEALGIPEANVLMVENATGAQMSRLFGTREDYRGQVYDVLRPGRSRVFVYYSGHGTPGTRDMGKHLAPVDADPARIEISGYSVATLLDNLGKLPSPEVTVVLEACFSGLSQAGAVLPAASPIAITPKAPKVPANVTLISAGAANQIASWEKNKSHGLFTKYFLLGMSGEADLNPYGNADGRVTYDELSVYLKDTLTHFARRYYGRDQEAQIVRGGGG